MTASGWPSATVKRSRRCRSPHSCSARHLQHHGVEGQAHGGHGNAILLAEIGQRLDVGVEGVERHGAIADGADRLYLVAAARALPTVSKDGKAAVP